MKDYRILSLTAFMVLCLAAVAGVAMAEEGDALNYEHGTSSNPLTGLDARADAVRADAVDGSSEFYIKVGSEVNIASILNCKCRELSSTSYGLTLDTTNGITGTVSKAGTVTFKITVTLAGVSTSETITLNFVNASSTTYYTVTFSASSSSYGSVNYDQISVPSGTTYSKSGNNLVFKSGTTTLFIVKPTPNSATSSYTYSFDGWSSTSGTIMSNKTITANFSREAVVSTVSFTVYKGNYGSFWVIGEDSYDTTVASKTYTVDAGTKVYIMWYGAETETSGTQASGRVTTVSYNDCDMIVKNNSNYPGGGTDRVTVEDGAKYYPAYAMDSTTSTTYYFKVSYNANGGSGAPSITDGGSSSSSSKSVTLSSTVPTRSGYTFLGWSASSTATSANYQPGSAYTFSYGTTPLYAVWKENSYTCYLAFNANGGSGAPNQLSFTGSSTSNHTFSIPNTVPTRSGYTFKGWADSSGATSPQYSAGGSISVGYNVTKTIYAVWEKNTLAIGSVSKQYAVVGEGVSFTASCSPSSGVSYGYSNATSGLTVSVNGNSITLNASNPGTYTFTLTASKTNYSSSSTTVTVEFVPELAFSNTPAQGTLTVW